MHNAHKTPMLVLNVPQVLYQDSTPVAWYFTSVKDNKVIDRLSQAVWASQVSFTS
jgi:hypothetical protein